MSRPYREIGKSLADRTVELIDALRLIADSLTQIRQGQVRYFITLSGQLRSLIAEKSSKTDSLLLYIAEVLQQGLRLYCMPDVHDPLLTDELRRDLLFQVSGFPITTERQYAAQLEMTLPEILDREIITFRGNNYTPRKVIEWYANKAGGAHYSRTLPEDFAELLALNVMMVQPLAAVLVQIGEATLATGLRLLKSVVDLDLHALVVVPDQDSGHVSDVNFLLDSQYEDTPMRISLVLNKRLMPSLFVSGLQGVAARVDCDRLIEWSEPRYIHAAVRIDDDLSTLLELWVDGTLVGRRRVSEPLFVLSDPLDYENYYNRAVDGEPQLFSFAAGIIGMYSRELGPIERANFLIYMDNKRQDSGLPLVLYTPKSFGRAARGAKDLTMTGTVRHVSVRDLVRKVPDSGDDDLPKE
jgi:hypothetical protein